MRKPLERCPSCGGTMVIKQLACTTCDTVVQGTYRQSRFDRLSPEDLRFLEIFISCRGNVKEMERDTGLSYWTVRGKLDDIIEILGLDNQNEPAENPPMNTEAQRREILLALETGEMTLEEAEAELQNLKKISGLQS